MREKGRKKKNRQISTIKMEEWSVRSTKKEKKNFARYTCTNMN